MEHGGTLKYFRGGVGERATDGRKISLHKEHIIAIVLTCGIFILGFHCTMGVLGLKTPAVMYDYWKKEENENTDIMLLGPSTMGANVDLAEFWQRYGIAGYNMGMSGSTMYDMYHRLIEAEKSHHTKLAVLDVSAMRYVEDYSGYEAKLENVSMLAPSWNKLDYVQTAVPAEERLSYFLGFPLYHDRYHDLSQWDYKFSTVEGEDDKGTRWRYYNKADALEIVSAKDICTYKAIDEKARYYFEKIIAYCKKNDIELLVIKTPDARRIQSQPIYNTVELLAEENEIPYLDFNLHDMEVGICSSDFADDHHLNIFGARKCADFLGEYLKANYQLTDHRGDAAYASWDRFAANREDLYLRAITDRADYFDELVRDNKKVVAIPYHLPERGSEDYQKLQEQLAAIPHSDWDKAGILYGEDCAGTFDLGSNEVVVTKNYDSCKITVNGKSGIEVQQPGLFLVVYDDVNDEIADIVEFERDNGYALKHLYSP